LRLAGDGDCVGRLGAGDGGLGCRFADGEDFIVFAVDDFADQFFGGDGLFDLVHLAEGFEGGLHEVSEHAGLAMVDGVAGKGAGNGIEVVEDGSVVLHVDEAYERDAGS
jgi:hypothetical protein